MVTGQSSAAVRFS